MAHNIAAYATATTPTTLSIESPSPPVKESLSERLLSRMLGFTDFSKRNQSLSPRNLHKDVEVDEELPFDTSICQSSYRGVFVVRLAIMVSQFPLQAVCCKASNN